MHGIANLYLHKIEAKCKIISYTNMVRWALGHANLPTKAINNHKGMFIGLFRPDDIHNMYKLPNPQITYNVTFH